MRPLAGVGALLAAVQALARVLAGGVARVVVRVVCAAALALAVGTAGAQPGPATAPPAAGKPSSAAGRSIPYKQDDDIAAQLARVGVGLVLVLGLGVGALVVYKRLAEPQVAGKRMRLLESLRLGPKATLLLVQVDGRTLLIGHSGDALAVLERPPAQDGH